MRIAVRVYGSVYEVPRSVTQADVRRAEPKFFERVPSRRRETISFYRGGLIVRYTVQYSAGPPRRETVPYLFGYAHEQGGFSTICLSTDCPSVWKARRLIDAAMDTGVQDYLGVAGPRERFSEAGSGGVA